MSEKWENASFLCAIGKKFKFSFQIFHFFIILCCYVIHRYIMMYDFMGFGSISLELWIEISFEVNGVGFKEFLRSRLLDFAFNLLRPLHKCLKVRKREPNSHLTCFKKPFPYSELHANPKRFTHTKFDWFFPIKLFKFPPINFMWLSSHSPKKFEQ